MLIDLFNTNKRAERGDTIIEVLISVAIVSLVLAGAYAITTRNVLTTQDTQEHGQALQLVQQQLEQLRASSESKTGLPSWPVTDTKCFTPAGGITAAVGNCKFASSGAACAANEQPCFSLTITKFAVSTYEITAKWDSVNGGTANVSMDYGI